MPLLSPRSIAVIGASAQEGKVGHDILKNLVTQGYKGDIYPVNPKGGEILGKTAYKTVGEIPEPVDVAIIVTPAATVNALVEECGAKKVTWVVVISAGFGEVHTDDGAARETQLKETATRLGIKLVGANCLGFLRPSLGLNASFAKDLPPAGSVALVSQSGAMAVALLDAAPALHMGYSAVLSIGNKTLLDECDYLEMLAEDPETTVIGFYLESIKDGRRFREVADRVSRTKPVVLLKAGVSERGKKAASSHTGALAGSDSAIDAVCAQSGIHRAHDAEEFLDLLRVLSAQPQLPSDAVAVVTNAGGPGILATDAAEKRGLSLATLDPDNETELRTHLPDTASTADPIDVIGDADANRYGAAVTACMEDPNVDGLVLLLTPQVMTPCAEIARRVAAAHRSRPLLPVTTAFMGGEGIAEAEKILAAAGIPNFPTPERAVAAMAALRPRPRSPIDGVHLLSASRAAKAADLLAGKTGLLSEKTTEELFALYDLPLPAQDVAVSADRAVSVAERIGYPVIAKVSSPDIAHKTDIGAVRANLKTAEDVRAAYAQIEANVAAHEPDATIRGVLIQKFLPVGSEFIVGSIRDASFGPLIMAGLGGIYTELFRDTAFRIAPIAEADAYAMLTDLKAWKLLLGMRGAAQSDIASLAATVSKISLLVIECPGIVELDCNPVLVGPQGIVIADVKVVVE